MKTLPDILNEEKLLKEANKRGFKKGVCYMMDGNKYKIKGDLFIRSMFKFGEGTDSSAFDYYVINHKGGNGCVYNGKNKSWGKIIIENKSEKIDFEIVSKIKDGAHVFIVPLHNHPDKGKYLQVNGMNIPFAITKGLGNDEGYELDNNLWYCHTQGCVENMFMWFYESKKFDENKGFKTPEEAIRYCAAFYTRYLKARLKGVELDYLNITDKQIVEFKKPKTKSIKTKNKSITKNKTK